LLRGPHDGSSHARSTSITIRVRARGARPGLGGKWLADAFIQLIQTITGPVIFVTVIVGIASLGNLARAGGLALRVTARTSTT
jgi:type IV secretory pathway VirB2 component (pilin)